MRCVIVLGRRRQRRHETHDFRYPGKGTLPDVGLDDCFSGTEPRCNAGQFRLLCHDMTSRKTRVDIAKDLKDRSLAQAIKEAFGARPPGLSSVDADQCPQLSLERKVMITSGQTCAKAAPYRQCQPGEPGIDIKATKFLEGRKGVISLTPAPAQDCFQFGKLEGGL